VDDADRIVVVGASLGGLHAITELLRDIPADFPTPIAFVQHRSPSAPDTLAKLLRMHSRLHVKEPSDKDPILPGTLYLAPADYHLIIEDHEFALSTGAAVCYARPSIDVLFDSAADAYGAGTIGIILTGANSDGSAGAVRIKKRGGRVIVQDPETAECAVMPRSAAQLIAPDRVLMIHEIGKVLMEWCSN
jgi:two-component system, chemotaxis family, protein-glutamate methylesterase/glutaminase